MYEKASPVLTSKARNKVVPKILHAFRQQTVLAASTRRHPDIVYRLAFARQAVEKKWEAELANEIGRQRGFGSSCGHVVLLH